MDDLAIINTNSIQVQDFQAIELMRRFIAYIDRSPATSRTYIINLRQFIAWMRYQDISHPSREDIISYRQWLTQEHYAIELDEKSPDGWNYRIDSSGHPLRITCKPNTVKQYLQSVRQFFSWLASEGVYQNVASNVHAPKVKTDSHRKDALTASEVLTIETSIENHAWSRQIAAEEAEKDRNGKVQRSQEQGLRLKAMYLLAVNAGLRTIEISRANVKDFETKGGQAWLYIWGKGHAEPDQKKPICPEVAVAIKDYLLSRTDKPTGESPLFVSTGNRSGGQRIAPTTISTILKRAMQQAGFDSERLTAHSLRHTAGNNVRKITGNNIYETQKYMRHSNPATTEIYMHDGEEELDQQADIAQRLYNRYHGTEETATTAELDTVAASMTPAQIQQLVMIAKAMKQS